jgi:hypothetical protein
MAQIRRTAAAAIEDLCERLLRLARTQRRRNYLAAIDRDSRRLEPLREKQSEAGSARGAEVAGR